MKSLFRRPIVIVLGVLGLVAVAVFVGKALFGGPDPLPKFISYFDRPGITYVKFKPLGAVKDELWIDYRARKAKQRLKGKKGKIESIVLIRGEDVRTYISSEKGLRKERLSESNEPVLMRLMRAAKEGDLVKVKRKKGLVYYKIKEGKAGDNKKDPDPDPTPQIALDEKSGMPRKTLEPNNDDVLVSFPILSVSRLPKSSAKRIFNMDELDPQILKARNTALGYTAKDLRKFKRFTPYWLGPEVMGAKVTEIKEVVEDGKFQALGIFYGSSKTPDVQITARKEGDVDFEGYWDGSNKRFRVQGRRAVLRKPPNEVYIEAGGGVYWILGLDRMSQGQQISYIKRNFQRP